MDFKWLALIFNDNILIHTIIPPYIFTISLAGLLFNSFVLVVFFAHKDRLTVAEIYLSNMALADFILLCSLPFWAMNILNEFNWPYGEALCKIVNALIIINFYTSIFTLVMISIDRYIAFVKPMKASWLRRTLYAKVICFILWILGVLLSTPTIAHRKVKFFEDYETTSCVLDYTHDSYWKLAHQIVINVVGFVLPVLVIVFSMYAVTLVFLLCWGPFQVITFLDILCDVNVLDEKLWSDSLDIGRQLSAYLAFLNSVLNPLLYVFSGQYFRKKVSAIYRKTRYQRRGSDMTTYQLSLDLHSGSTLHPGHQCAWNHL
uniref:Bradykinin receptor B1 n=1 Tax=Pundamilia nyererei TaxID=303518 RepID=A0A3B4GKN0_9CICH